MIPARAAPRPRGARPPRLLPRVVLLAIAFVAVPVALYEPFRRAEETHRAQPRFDLQARAGLVAAALAPLLDRDDPLAVARLDRAALGIAAEGTTLRILHARGDGAGDLLVAAHPPLAARDVVAIRERLDRAAADAGLDRAHCRGGGLLEPRGDGEHLVAIALRGSASDCWTLLVGGPTAQRAAAPDAPAFWRAPEMRAAAITHLALFAVALWLVVRSWRDARAAASSHPPVIAAAASVDLRNLLADRVFALHEACTRDGLSLSYEAPRAVLVRARPAEVDAVLAPLLARAVAASRRGDVLRVALGVDDAAARLHIEDAGRGGPDDQAVVASARRTLEEIGGALDTQRLDSGAFRVAARFPLGVTPNQADART